MISCDPWGRDELGVRSSVVGIDFDETITDNPQAWLRVMETLEKAGYQVVVVTWRAPDCYPEDLQFLIDKGYKVYFTSWKAKRQFVMDAGLYVDIVIDDNPWAWDNDAVEIWPMERHNQPSAEGEDNGS